MYSANNPNEEILRLRADNERLRAALKTVADILEKYGCFEKLAVDVAILYAAAALKETWDE